MSDKKAPAEIRRDTELNWLKAINFTPKLGMIIVYDFEDGNVGLKLGDGKTLVNDLPFLNNIMDNQDKAPKPSVKGDLLEFKY